MKNIFKKSWNQAKKVVAKGNMFMLAIGLLVGSAFGTLVNSLANDLIMQAISKTAGFNGIKFMSWGTTKWMDGVHVVSTPTKNGVDLLPANGIMYGKFLGALISFLIIVFFIFATLLTIYIIINYKNKDKKEEKQASTNEEKILSELVKLNKVMGSKTNKITKKKAK